MDAIDNEHVIVHEGVIFKSVSGFYYIWADDHDFVTKPKGLFRHQKEKPMVGDIVQFEEHVNQDNNENRLTKIFPRKNNLVRPPVANVDYAILVMSLIEPDFSFTLLDQYLLTIEWQNIRPILLLTKYDVLVEKKGIEEAIRLVDIITSIYHKAGYPVWIKEIEPEFTQAFISSLSEGIYVVMGQSGVGKSTFLNQLDEKIEIETNEISQSLNRGKHTTREVTLYRINDAMIADTPGFSAMEIPEMDPTELKSYFPDIFELGQQCKYRTCLHDQEPQCHVKQAVELGKLASSRYDSYRYLLDKIRNTKKEY